MDALLSLLIVGVGLGVIVGDRAIVRASVRLLLLAALLPALICPLLFSAGELTVPDGSTPVLAAIVATALVGAARRAWIDHRAGSEPRGSVPGPKRRLQ